MPESARSPYQRLVGDPCLLMEQLLVDTKVCRIHIPALEHSDM